MIDRQHGKFVVECDSCSEVLETGTDDVGRARARLAHEGWFARELNQVWQHGCPQCGAQS